MKAALGVSDRPLIITLYWCLESANVKTNHRTTLGQIMCMCVCGVRCVYMCKRGCQLGTEIQSKSLKSYEDLSVISKVMFFLVGKKKKRKASLILNMLQI